MGVSVGDSGAAIEINIMPLLDVFSILVTFLLMAYSTDPVSYDINAGVELPSSLTIQPLDEVPTIAVTKTEIQIQQKVVAQIVNGDVAEKDRSQGAVFPVFEELEKLAESNKRLQRRRDIGGKDKTSTLTMEMDKGHKFKLMKRIMLSAQQAEFVTFKLMTTRD